MSAIKRSASILAVLLFALAAGARAQTAPAEVALDGDRALFSVLGEARRLQVEIYAPGGELLFAGEAAEGGAVEWGLRDRAGRRVADGVYLAAVTVTDSAGEVTKRVEQVVVGGEAQAFAGTTAANAPDPTPQAPAALTGEGTTGKIAKFTGTHLLGNSVIAESAGKVGVGTTAAPVATLQVNGPQPAANPADGTNATRLLETTGGKGGNTTTAGQVAGAGAGIYLRGGNGGNAVANSTNGSGGSITLQGGLAGTGGTGGSAGHVLLAPAGGNVGIGTDAPASRLTVQGKASKLVSITNEAGVIGLFAKAPTEGVHGEGSTYGVSGVGGAVGTHGQGTAAGVTGTGGTIGVSGTGESYGVKGQSDDGQAVYGSSTTGYGGRFASTSGTGVYAFSSTGYAGKFQGVVGVTGTVEIGGTAFFGSATRQMIILHTNGYGIGVQPSTHYSRTNGGFAWYKGGRHNNTAFSPGTDGVRLMKLDSAGNLTATSFNQTSDRNTKANFAPVNPRAVLDKLRSLPIQTWSYKADGAAVRHIGPVAQDFKAAFGLGADDKTISTVDAAGVTMAAIQALYQQNQELAQKVERLQSRLDRVTRTLRRRRAGKR